MPAALIRGLFGYSYSATALLLTAQVPATITSLTQAFPVRFGGCWLWISSQGSGPITGVSLNGSPLAPSQWNSTTVSLLYNDLGCTTAPDAAGSGGYSNITVVITLGSGSAAAAASCEQDTVTASHVNVVQRYARPIVAAGPPAGALLWLKADTLGLSPGARVATWPDASGNGNDATQANTTLQPVFQPSAYNGMPAVVFDGAATFLSNDAMALPAGSTIIAAFRDVGTSTTCCSGVFMSKGGCNGLSTKVIPNPDGSATNITVVSIDWSGSPDSGFTDVHMRPTVATVLYNASASVSYVNGCTESLEGPAAAAGTGYFVGSRNNELARYFGGSLAELLVYPTALSDADRHQAEQYLFAKWNLPTTNCSGYPQLNCTLSPALTAVQANLTSFLAGMRGAAYPDARYESAHAILFLQSLEAWSTRCAMLVNGTLPLLPTLVSQRAADALYVQTSQNLGSGLMTVLSSYAGSNDPDKQRIYNIFTA